MEDLREELETQNDITVEKSERDLLKDKADLLGLTYAQNISTTKLRDMIKKVNEPEVEKDEVTPVSKTDTDATAEDPVQVARAMLTKKVRCIISCNDPAMKEWDMTPYYSFSNSAITLPKITIPLNVEWHIPYAYFIMLKDMDCRISVKGKDELGRKITVRKIIKKYNVQELPPLTKQELEDLRQAQIMRDGITA